MDFSGPQPADFDNIQSLNRAFLRHLRKASRGQRIRQAFVPAQRAPIKAMSDLQIERLSATPFLLLSLRERDGDYWRVLTDDNAQDDLFPDSDTDDGSGQLTAAALAFMWQLSRRSPYATRLVSGATLGWCEQIAECTLLRLLQQTSARNDLLRPRLAEKQEFWTKLLGPGLSARSDVRRAAQLTALQSILTEDPARHYRPTRAAACHTLAPSLRLAAKRDGS